MRNLATFFLIICLIKPSFSQDAKELTNSAFLKKLNKDKSYTDLKKRIVSECEHISAGHWGEFVTGVDEIIITQKKIIAFTFDACGGKICNCFY